MLKIKEKGLLQNIIKHCESIERVIKNLTKEQFESDNDKRDLVCFHILQIGELAKHFDDNFVKTYAGVPWNKIKGMRDKVAHGYDTIKTERVWATSTEDIEPLHEYCDKLIKED